MTASFTCNVCKEPIALEDAERFERERDGIRVSFYAESKDRGDTHLCPKCTAAILLAGTRPVRDPNEADF